MSNVWHARHAWMLQKNIKKYIKWAEIEDPAHHRFRFLCSQKRMHVSALMTILMSRCQGENVGDLLIKMLHVWFIFTYIYPLVNIQKTMERSTHFSWENSRNKWWFSSSLFVCLPEGTPFTWPSFVGKSSSTMELESSRWGTSNITWLWSMVNLVKGARSVDLDHDLFRRKKFLLDQPG